MSEGEREKVLIVGSGGVGAIAALSLSLNQKAEVTLIVRSDYDKVVQDGYSFNSVTYGSISGWRPQNMARSVTEARERFGEFDFLILTTKNVPDGPVNCEDIIEPAVSAKTTIVLLQNGIGIEKPMIKRFPKNIILSGVSLIGSTNFNCKVTNPQRDDMFIGAWKNSQNASFGDAVKDRIDKFVELYHNDKYNRVMVDENVERTRWRKLLFNSSFNTICAIAGLDVTRCQMTGANDTLFRPAMKEIQAIAASEGIEIDDFLIERSIHICDGKFYSPSMCVDARKNQLMELEIILGNPLRVAKANGVATPLLSTIYNLLLMVQLRIKEQIGVITIKEDDHKNFNSDNYPSEAI